MQPIERYGVIALIFLVITLAAAWLWTPDEEEPDASAENAVAAAEPKAGKVQLTAPTVREGRALGRKQPRQEPKPQPWNRGEGQRKKRGDFPVVKGDEILSVDASDRKPTPRVEAKPIEAPAPKVTTKKREEPPSRPLQRRSEKRLYTVKPGDTLSEISLRELGTSTRWREIVELNPGLDPMKLRENTRLVMPERGEQAPRTQEPEREAPPAAAPPPDAKPYVVQQDDSLWKIAARALGDGARWPEIAKLNPTMNPDKLSPGDKLFLPGDAAVAARPRVNGAPSPEATSTRRKGVVR